MNRIKFLITFLVLFGTLFFLQKFMVGITIPGGLYNQWIAEHLDYITAYKKLILKGASLFVDIFGFENYIDTNKLHIPGYIYVRLSYSCLGFDVLSFWNAFVIAYPQPVKIKIAYSIIGTIFITVLNMIRVGAVGLMFTVKNFNPKAIDHHFVFNITAYGIIFLMIFIMLNRKSKPTKD